MKPWEWKQARRFYKRVERLDLHGLHFQHIALCERRAWLYLHNVNFAHWHGRVALGTVRHAQAFKRDHSVVGLFGLAPDMVDWENCVVHENKGTGGAVLAADSLLCPDVEHRYRQTLASKDSCAFHPQNARCIIGQRVPGKNVFVFSTPGGVKLPNGFTGRKTHSPLPDLLRRHFLRICVKEQ